MIGILQKIFIENGFAVQHFISMPTNIFALDTHRGSYYLAVFVEENMLDSMSVELFNSYFDEVKELEEGYRPEMDKNLSLIVCVKRGELRPYTGLNKIIFDIEEDPYFFKKYVLTYTDSQVELLKANLGESSILEHLHRVLNDNNAFQEHKNDPLQSTEYNLVSKLFIKLPFLNLRKMDRELASLNEEINNSLTPPLLALRDELLKLKPEEKTNEAAWRKSILVHMKVEENE